MLRPQSLEPKPPIAGGGHPRSVWVKTVWCTPPPTFRRYRIMCLFQNYLNLVTLTNSEFECNSDTFVSPIQAPFVLTQGNSYSSTDSFPGDHQFSNGFQTLSPPTPPHTLLWGSKDNMFLLELLNRFGKFRSNNGTFMSPTQSPFVITQGNKVLLIRFLRTIIFPLVSGQCFSLFGF